MLEVITKKIAALIPGTRAHLASDKRRMEHELRAAGYSRSQAVAMTALHFKSQYSPTQ